MMIATALAWEFSIVKVQRVEFLKKQRTGHLIYNVKPEDTDGGSK